ncbi:MAG: tetraacyldisaccharide 4'-kinase [Candidatus Accumulibacter sp.]|jgi:tetraacyldisaccharide 4'-kinase|nr:tetraacyldisaccharide 4'-kinase [Accumulibacter sp.]
MSRGEFPQSLPRLWFRERLSPALLPLLPLSWLFRGLVALRRLLYRQRILPSVSLPVPVIVVGNLTVGGSGKTPLVLWLVERLRERGWRPGIVSRGYGGEGGEGGAVRPVFPASDAARVGDEPLLLARRSGVPVFAGRDRVAAGNALLAAHPECDVLVSDDGLQHYRLERRVEIAVFDRRGAGNGRLLPAGPLREPPGRLAGVTAVVLNGGGDAREYRSVAPCFSMHLAGQCFVALEDRRKTCPAAELRGKSLHAVAGIGDPSRFFSQLAGLGLEFSPHAFPDHHVYREEDLAFARGGVLLMTEKDAVKCAGLALPETWVLPVEARIDDAPDGSSLLDTILEKLNGRTPA